MNKKKDWRDKPMTEGKEYYPMHIVQHSSKIKFKDYVFSVETKEWLGTNDHGTIEGTLKKMAEVNVYLRTVKNPTSSEGYAMKDRVPLRTEKKIISDSVENYALLLHRVIKKEIEQKLKENPKAYLGGIEKIVEDYKKENFSL